MTQRVGVGFQKKSRCSCRHGASLFPTFFLVMSYSVPTSPAVSRSTKAQPLTPQRPLQKHQQRSQSLYRSPLTPSASPYTPISLRSVDTTGSSTLTTPDNSGLGSRKRLVFAASPEVVRNGSVTKDRSLADIAENWRSRESPNQVKTSYASNGDPGYVMDECESIYAQYFLPFCIINCI